MNEHHSFYNMKKVKSQWLFPPKHDFGVEIARHAWQFQLRNHVLVGKAIDFSLFSCYKMNDVHS